MDPMEGAQIGPKRRAGPCSGTAVHFMSALFVIIAHPLVPAVADSGLAPMAPPIALPLIGREPHAAREGAPRSGPRRCPCGHSRRSTRVAPPSRVRSHG
jgi:hypothetical protein